jgi:hypothetical protein
MARAALKFNWRDKMNMRRWWLLAAGLLVLGAWLAAGDIVEEATGQKFAAERQVQAAGKTYDLACTGTGVRKKFVIKVYALGFYVDNEYRHKLADQWRPKVPKAADLGENEAFLQALVKDAYCRQFEMKFVREVEAEKIRGAFLEGIEDNLPQMKKMPELAAAAKKFVGWFQSTVAEGDRLVITILPDGTVEAFHNDKQLGTLQDAVLAQGITGIWLGKECISEDLRSGVVGKFY